jgi:hypothetical protein
MPDVYWSLYPIYAKDFKDLGETCSSVDLKIVYVQDYSCCELFVG